VSKVYRINESRNAIELMPERRFSSSGFREREHLQEWIASCPECLGEALLVIQKEFDGFAGTSERIDMLALDKNGNLVVIENKLDNSGRDATGQALKYATYCSELTQDEIINNYQAYLDSITGGEIAEDRLCNFFDVPDIKNLNLNRRSSPRIIITAAHFRNEVTKSAHYLRRRGVDVRCIRIGLRRMSGENLLIIEPLDDENRGSWNESVELDRPRVTQEFWAQLIPYLKCDEIPFFRSIGPTSKCSIRETLPGFGSVAMNLNRHEINLELTFTAATAVRGYKDFDHGRFQERVLFPIECKEVSDKHYKLTTSYKKQALDRDDWILCSVWFKTVLSRLVKAATDEFSWLGIEFPGQASKRKLPLPSEEEVVGKTCNPPESARAEAGLAT
jgi:hypothetical protein